MYVDIEILIRLLSPDTVCVSESCVPHTCSQASLGHRFFLGPTSMFISITAITVLHSTIDTTATASTGIFSCFFIVNDVGVVVCSPLLDALENGRRGGF